MRNKSPYDLRILKDDNSFNKRFPLHLLEAAYNDYTLELEKENFSEHSRTYYERAFLKFIMKHTKLKILTSFWIGTRNIDIFIPGVRNRVDPHKEKRIMNGLAIELDGQIHNQIRKGKRDNHKQSILHKLNIGCLVIENEDIRKININTFLYRLSTLVRLDFRGKRRLMRNIYLETLFTKPRLAIIEKNFGKDKVAEFMDTKEQFKNYKNTKRGTSIGTT